MCINDFCYTQVENIIGLKLYFSKHKELIREALEIYLNQSSSSLYNYGGEEEKRVYRERRIKRL